MPENEKKKENKEDSSLKYILIMMVVLVVFYCGGYLIGTHLIPQVTKTTSGPVINEHREIKYNDKDETIVRLLEHLTVGPDCWNIEKFANDKKITSADLDDSTIFEIVSLAAFDKVGSFTLDEFHEKVKEYFKEGYTFNPEKIDKNKCFHFAYKADTKTFERLDQVCGGTCGPNSTQYKVMGGVEKNSILTVDVKVLFGSQAEDVKFYSDYKRTNFVSNDAEHLDQYFIKGGDYVFTFEKVDGYYVFVSSEAK